MRRLATALSAVAFLGACAATIYLLTAANYEGVSTGAVLSGGSTEPIRVTRSFVSVNGFGVIGLLLGVTLVAGVPLGIALAWPRNQQAATWSTALLLLGFSIISGFWVGLLFLPSAAVLLGAAIVTVFFRSTTRRTKGAVIRELWPPSTPGTPGQARVCRGQTSLTGVGVRSGRMPQPRGRWPGRRSPPPGANPRSRRCRPSHRSDRACRPAVRGRSWSVDSGGSQRARPLTSVSC